MGRFRDEIAATWHARRPRRPVHSTGDTAGSEHGVVERLGLDVHRPVRPPDKWRQVRILGGTVFVRGHQAAASLLECPLCACLIVGDKWAQSRHREVCVAEVAAEPVTIAEGE